MNSAQDELPEHGSAEVAVQRMVDEHGGQLFQLALRFCGNREEAEDLVQEVFLQVFRSWATFRGESSEKTWLYRIAARACQRRQRKRSGEPDTIGSLQDLLPFDEPRIAALPGSDDDMLQQQIRREARERIESAIAALPEDFRVPMVLKEIIGFSIRDVAEMLGLEEGTVRSRVHRARLKLRAAVDAGLPRTAEPVPPPAYPEQTCLDLLDAKQEALDRGVPFDASVICERCRTVFATLDLTRDACRELATTDTIPAEVRERLVERLGLGASG